MQCKVQNATNVQMLNFVQEDLCYSPVKSSSFSAKCLSFSKLTNTWVQKMLKN